jgi:hypothetical protein
MAPARTLAFAGTNLMRQVAGLAAITGRTTSPARLRHPQSSPPRAISGPTSPTAFADGGSRTGRHRHNPHSLPRHPAGSLNPASMRSRPCRSPSPRRATSQKPPDSRRRRFVILMSVFKGEDVWLQALLAGARILWAAHGWTRRREATVDQTLMRGLVTAGPWFTLGLPLSQWRECRGLAESRRGLP